MKQPTIKDIAKLCNVSTATVSYVLSNNQKQAISDAVREAVLKCAVETGYLAAKANRNLKKYKTRCIGVVSEKDICTTRFNTVLQGIHDKLAEEDFNIMLCALNNHYRVKNLPDYLVQVMEGAVDGVIYVGNGKDGPDDLANALIAKNKLPFVAYNCGLEDKVRYATLEMDYALSGRSMIKELQLQKAQNILYIEPQIISYQEQMRKRGLNLGLQQYPDIKFYTCQVPITSDNLYRPHINYRQQEDVYIFREIYPFLLEKLKALTVNFGENDCVLVSWGSFLNPVSVSLKQLGRNMKLAALSDVFVSPALGREVLVCQFLGYEIGINLADLLLDTLKYPNKEKAHLQFPMPLALVEHY